MNNERINQIAENLRGLGTKAGVLYTNQEIVTLLTDLQAAMAKGVFEKTHAENLRDRDIMIHFEALAKEYGLNETETFTRFKANMNELGYTIGSFIKGMKGERIARKTLKLLNYDKSVKILYNIQLEDEDVQAEYDAIVVTGYGIFVVEVKNWGTQMTISPAGLLVSSDGKIVYDVPGRMCAKEALLREHLGELFPKNYHSMLLFPNERAKVDDEYHKIPVICGGGIAYEIKDISKTENILTEEEIQNIAETILMHHKEQKTLCTVKCEQIIADYAMLMAQIEEASSKVNLSTDDLVDDTEPAKENAKMEEESEYSYEVKWWEQVDWAKVVRLTAYTMSIVVPGVASAVKSHKR